MRKRWSYHLPFREVRRKSAEFAWRWSGKKTRKKKHDLGYCPTAVMSSACPAFDAGELHSSLTRKLSSEKIFSKCQINIA